MSKINKIQVDETTYDIEDLSVPSWAKENTKPSYDYSEITNAPTKLSEFQNDEGFISQELEPQFNASASKNITSQDITNWNSKSDFSGNYEDLTNKPNIPDSTSDLTNDSGFINNTVSNLTNYELKADTGHSIAMSIDSSTYVLTLSLKNSAGTILNTQTVDLPLESVVVDGEYDSTNKKIVLELESGSTIDIPVGDLINGLQSEITSSNKLDSDLVDDTNQTNKFVTSAEKTTWGNKYDKPIAGIPYSDLASGVQDSLDLADSAIQSNDLASVATSGDYDDLTNKPDTSLFEQIANKISTIDSSSTNTQYPGAKAVYDLISSMGGGTNIYMEDLPADNGTFNFSEKELGMYVFNNFSPFSTRSILLKKSTGTGFRIQSTTPLIMFYYKDVDEVGTPTANTEIATLLGVYIDSSDTNYGGELSMYRISINTSGNFTYVKAGSEARFITPYAQLISGVKTFSSFPITPSSAPTTDYQTANKKYVDDSISNAIGSINTILATLTTPGGNQ